MEFKNKELTKEELEVVNASRNLAGVKEIEENGNKLSLIDKQENLSIEEIKAKKDKLNEDEKRRIKQQNGLRPNAIFYYHILNWDQKIEKVVIKYPSTRQALKYGKLSFDNETGRAEMLFNDTVLMFIQDKLITDKFDLDNFQVTEVQELNIFLSSVINNPFLK